MSEWRWFRADGERRRHAFSREAGGVWIAACGAERTRRCRFVAETDTPACARCERIAREAEAGGGRPELGWYATAGGRWHLAHVGYTGYRSLCGLDIIPVRPEIERFDYFSCKTCQRALAAMEAA